MTSQLRFYIAAAFCGAVCILALHVPAVSLAAEGAAAPAVVAPAAPEPAGQPVLRVHLAVDGNVPGMVSVLDGGARLPIRAAISVFQNGLMLTTTHSNDRGRFQLPGLRPGVYSVIADAGKRFGVFTVEVLPCAEPVAQVSQVSLAEGPAAEPAESYLDLTLVAEAGEQVEGAAPAPLAMETYGYPVISGGGGGGGGGKGWLAGLASLAGLAGLAGLGGGGSGPASPAAP